MSDEPKPSRDQIGAAIARRAWHDEAFHKAVLADPGKVYEEQSGQALPPGVTITVLEDTATTVHFVLPAKPAPIAELSEDELSSVAGGVQVQTRSYYNPPPVLGPPNGQRW